MYCSHWFITVFAYTLPFEHLLRVWDIFLFEGLKVMMSFSAPMATCHSCSRFLQEVVQMLPPYIWYILAYRTELVHDELLLPSRRSTHAACVFERLSGCCAHVTQTVFRVGLALMKTVEAELLRVDFEKLLGALNAKWFPAFARGPDELLRIALRIKISGRLKRYKALYEQQQARDESS